MEIANENLSLSAHVVHVTTKQVISRHKGPCKRSQHFWPTRRNIVGPNMLRAFAHQVACCCDLLEVVG